VILWPRIKSHVSKQWKFTGPHATIAFDYKNINKVGLEKTSLCVHWLNGNVELFCTLLVFVFGQIIGSKTSYSAELW